MNTSIHIHLPAENNIICIIITIETKSNISHDQSEYSIQSEHKQHGSWLKPTLTTMAFLVPVHTHTTREVVGII